MHMLTKLDIILSKIPFFKNRIERKIKKQMDNEDTKDKIIYKTFEDFLKACPDYQIKSNTSSKIIRSIMKKFGAEFQQFVFIDKGSYKDKTVWLRREKGIVKHQGGTYFLPWKYEKPVCYFDMVDSRPLIDMTDEMDWQNGDMCADNVTALTNSTTLQGGNRDTLILIAIIAAVSAAVLAVISIYLQSKNHDITMQAVRSVYDLVNSSAVQHIEVGR